jgi:hypothetical protein
MGLFGGSSRRGCAGIACGRRGSVGGRGCAGHGTLQRATGSIISSLRVFSVVVVPINSFL